MAGLGDIMNKLENCGGDQANTGKLGCLQAFGTPLSAILTKSGFVIPKETTLDIAYLTANVQNGNLIPLMDASSFEDVSAEDAFSTNAAGVERLNLQGLPKYKLMFEEGHEFYREMTKLTSYKSKGAILIDDAGRWLFGVNSDGDYVGLTLGQVTAEMRKTKVQGGDAESKALSMQFTDRYQWDMSYMIVERAELGFSTSEVPTINGVNIEFTAIPLDGAEEVFVKVTLASDGSPVEGLDADDLLITNIGDVITLFNSTEASPGYYELDTPALNYGEVTAELNDVIISDEVLYRSNVATAII